MQNNGLRVDFVTIKSMANEEHVDQKRSQKQAEILKIKTRLNMQAIVKDPFLV